MLYNYKVIFMPEPALSNMQCRFAKGRKTDLQYSPEINYAADGVISEPVA